VQSAGHTTQARQQRYYRGSCDGAVDRAVQCCGPELQPLVTPELREQRLVEEHGYMKRRRNIAAGKHAQQWHRHARGRRAGN